MQIIDTKSLIEKQKTALKNEIGTLQDIPSLAIIQVDGISQSDLYVKNKIKLAEEIGVKCNHIKFLKNCSQLEIIQAIHSLNADEKTHGIIVQLPLPKHLNEYEIINSINPCKDVDGLTIVQKGYAEEGDSRALYPCTAMGVVEIIKSQCDIKGLDVVVVNRSSLIGKPLQKMLTNLDATVTLCHSKTKNLQEKMLNADIVITGVGVAKKFNFFWFRDLQVIVDCSMNFDDGKICGDIDVNSLECLDVHIASGKGHTGPFTVLSLMKNTVKASKMLKKSF